MKDFVMIEEDDEIIDEQDNEKLTDYSQSVIDVEIEIRFVISKNSMGIGYGIEKSEVVIIIFTKRVRQT